MGVTTLEIMTPQELLEALDAGEIVYDEIITALLRYSPEDRGSIMDGVHKIQWQFWNNPETVDYYRYIHPQLPPIEGHFEALLKMMSIKNDDIVVDLGCGYGKLIQRILANGSPQW